MCTPVSRTCIIDCVVFNKTPNDKWRPEFKSTPYGMYPRIVTYYGPVAAEKVAGMNTAEYSFHSPFLKPPSVLVSVTRRLLNPTDPKDRNAHNAATNYNIYTDATKDKITVNIWFENVAIYQIFEISILLSGHIRV